MAGKTRGRLLLLFVIFLLAGCEERNPTYYYSIENFDIIRLGSNIADLIITPDGEQLIAADAGNNRVLFIDIQADMSVTRSVIVGSKPTSLALSGDGSLLVVGLSGSSQVALVNTADYSVDHFLLDEDSPLDVEYWNGCLITTFISDQSIFHRTKMYDLVSGSLLGEKPKAGRLTADQEQNRIFTLDQSFERVNLYRYDISGNTLSGNLQSSDIAAYPVVFNDIDYIPGTGIAVAVSGTDFEGQAIRQAYLYEPESLNLVAHLALGTAPVALSHSPDGSRIFVAPGEADGAGTFIIEFDNTTFLQRNYYLTAGKIHPGAMIVDPAGEYLYVAVDDLADNSKDEPYSSNSYDIQRIALIPVGTYPINDF